MKQMLKHNTLIKAQKPKGFYEYYFYECVFQGLL